MVNRNNIFYVDPLGNINEESITTKYTNSLKKNRDTLNAKENDLNKKIKSNKYNLLIWSIVAALFILIFLIILRNINN